MKLLKTKMEKIGVIIRFTTARCRALPHVHRSGRTALELQAATPHPTRMSRLSLSRRRAASSDTASGQAFANTVQDAVDLVEVSVPAEHHDAQPTLSDSITGSNLFVAHKRRHAQLLKEAEAGAEPDLGSFVRGIQLAQSTLQIRLE